MKKINSCLRIRKQSFHNYEFQITKYDNRMDDEITTIKYTCEEKKKPVNGSMNTCTRTPFIPF